MIVVAVICGITALAIAFGTVIRFGLEVRDDIDSMTVPKPSDLSTKERDDA